MLSNYAGGVKNAPPDSYFKNKKEGDLEDGAGSGEWGELNGWWTDKKRGIETFEVELFRPLGFKLAEVCDREVYLWGISISLSYSCRWARMHARMQVNVITSTTYSLCWGTCGGCQCRFSECIFKLYCVASRHAVSSIKYTQSNRSQYLPNIDPKPSYLID